MTAETLITETRKLARSVDARIFSDPVHLVYNPLVYARRSHELYLTRYAASPKRVLFLGMNPGPFGMAQTGVPFGEIEAVRDWLEVEAPVEKPKREHPKRPVQGFACKRSEVSGRRLWGLFRERFQTPDAFFKEHYVSNYCPLLFLNERGANLTPDKVARTELQEVYAACDLFLKKLIETLQVEFVVGIGNFAYKKLEAVASDFGSLRVAKILHPSPASPAANRGWAKAATDQLKEAGIW